jgi:hypothetical protein
MVHIWCTQEMQRLAGSPLTPANDASIDSTVKTVHQLLLLGEQVCRAALDRQMLSDLLILLGNLQDPIIRRPIVGCITTLLKSESTAAAAWEIVGVPPTVPTWLGALQALSTAFPHDAVVTEALLVTGRHRIRDITNVGNV